MTIIEFVIDGETFRQNIIKPHDHCGIFDLLEKQKLISVDIEGVGLCAVGQISIIQIGVIHDKSNKVFIFDMLHIGPQDQKRLKNILEDRKIKKIMHDCRADSGALYHQLGITIQNVFDTQAYNVIVRSMVPGKKLMQLSSLTSLYKIYLLNGFNTNISDKYVRYSKANHESIEYYNTLASNMMNSTNCECWLKRPLNNNLLIYSVNDVCWLFDLYFTFILNPIYSSISNKVSELTEKFMQSEIKNKQKSIDKCSRHSKLSEQQRKRLVYAYP